MNIVRRLTSSPLATNRVNGRVVRLMMLAITIGCSRAPESSSAQASGVVASTNAQISQGRQNAITAAVAKVAPSVVTVQTEVVDQSPQDPFDVFFGRAQPRTQAGLGTGFVVRKEGVIVTNAHVVAGANKVSVMARDGTVYPAKVLGADETNDIAVLKIDAKSLSEVKLGNSNALAIGEWAIAIGNPFGLDNTVTVGVVSATGRADVGIATYENFIQTDASINPGNSGGPLVNLRGEVIGINTAIVATGQGIGFAIPANMVKRVTGQLMDRGKVTRGWIGIAMEPLTSELAQSFGLSEARGAVVARVYPGGPAAAAGLEKNDVVVTFEGVPVDDYRQLQRLSADAEVGKTVKIEIVRNRAKKTIELRVAEAPDRTTPDRPTPPRDR
jgi:Do/DeqQ family serine protease